MSALSRKDVLHVAKLAKLELTSAEEKKLEKELSEVVGYISQLKKVDTENTEATSQTTVLTDVTRADEVDTAEYLTPEEATSGSEKIHNGYFEVAAVLPERGAK